jgi:hypothetical protein
MADGDMLSDEALTAATDEVLELAEPQGSLAERWAEQSGDGARPRRRTVIVDSATGEPVELSRLSHPEWSERVVAKALAKQMAERSGH